MAAGGQHQCRPQAWRLGLYLLNSRFTLADEYSGFAQLVFFHREHISQSYGAEVGYLHYRVYDMGAHHRRHGTLHR